METPDITNALSVDMYLNQALAAAEKQDKLSPGSFKATIMLIKDTKHQLAMDKEAYQDEVHNNNQVDI